ncbi:unnamed protein product [Rhizophagus irregularis]|nr:unnamed protein product [Rhizophagus irregularis]
MYLFLTGDSSSLNAIEKVNSRVEYYVYKAEILAEIELLYLLPHQRRWHKWFPEVIYYYADVDKVRQKIKEMIKESEWNTDEFLELKKNLLDKLNIQHNPVDEANLQDISKEIRDLRSKLPQQPEATLQDILNEVRDLRSKLPQQPETTLQDILNEIRDLRSKLPQQPAES